MAELTDHEIVALYHARDERAIQESDRKYGNYCMAVSMNILHDRLDAEECVNDAWLKAWHSMPPHWPTVLRTFLGKITRHLSLNRLEMRYADKRNPDLVIALEELGDCIPMPEETTEQELCCVISDFLYTQPKLERQLFVGRYWYAHTVKELAFAHGLSPNAATKRLSRTREALRIYLEERGYRI
jgi:RNA polymerase sigma-70 factor (ECF subfamily)